MAFEVNIATAAETSYTATSKVFNGGDDPEQRPMLGKFICDVSSTEGVWMRVIGPDIKGSIGRLLAVGDHVVLSGKKTGGIHSVEVYSAGGAGKYSIERIQ